MKSHTPTPWEVYGPSVQGLVIKHGQLNIAFIPQELSSIDEANAAFIVRAVNNFDLAIKYLGIEHRKEKAGPHHAADCDLCDFIAKAG